ncbi:FAD/NAD(P)-binding domain-containing protein [Eremomyces bilateralis CBS 781.70]|uniref:FAD/NAD(P)-binding domain-containing protein n=1 Tax=Eremomyces bilateralis CBS 781.70 TaxID=1392243 RepID=A0A6G1G1A7_9PEZI|nr:FAD/NAD(P)-binding domain-containing protein [Eremomyces bilateralis CBS 781.70]KAF1811823.1 FAD/NAD(P)-binding domain-containing protein [Eremomyces bilateralis CBS 781.70]
MKVLITGAGITGNALAFWLSKIGHGVTIIEQFPPSAMRCMGLEQVFRAKLAPEQGLQVVDKSGRRRAYFPANKSSKGLQNFTIEFEIMRGDLCRLIYDATKDRAKYIFGASVESFEEKENSVEGSRIRKMMFESRIADAAYHPLKGVNMAYFTICQPIREGEEYIATAYMAPGKRVIMTRRHSPHEIQVYLGCTTNSERLKNARQEGDVGEQKADWEEVFQGAGWQTEGIFKSLMGGNTDFYDECPAMVKLESWSRGRVTLIGDAAYCPTATTGLGTTCAIIGAYVLAGEIGRPSRRSNGEDVDRRDDAKYGPATALEAYQRKFQPFIDQVQKGVSVSEDTGFLDMLTSSPSGIAILNNLLYSRHPRPDDSIQPFDQQDRNSSWQGLA